MSEQEIINRINRANTASDIKSLIKLLNSENVYNAAISRVASGSILSGSEVLDTIAKISKSPNTLINVINCTNYGDTIILAVENMNANEDVCNAAISRVKSGSIYSGSDIEKKLEEALADFKRNKPLVNQKQDKIKDDKFIVEQEDDVTEMLRTNVSECASTMLWGLSGIGKTSRVKQIDPNYTEIRLKNGMLPEEVVGGRNADGTMTPPAWLMSLKKKCEEDPEHVHILFIDEFTNVSRSVQALVMDVIENRRVNGNEDWKLPENCAIVAAGNRPSESSAVVVDQHGGVMPEPTHRRFDYQIEIVFDIKEWQKWALEINSETKLPNIHPIVLAYCLANSDKVMYSTVNQDNPTQPALDPRRWAKVSKSIYCAEARGGKNNRVSTARLISSLGTNIGISFSEFYQTKSFDIEKVKEGEYTKNTFISLEDKLYALSNIIADNSLSDVIKQEFIEECLGEEYWSLYCIIKNKSDKNKKQYSELPKYESFNKSFF